MPNLATDTATYTPKTLAARWGCLEAHVRDLIAAGRLVAFNAALDPKGGKPRWRITPEAVEDFERMRSTRPKLKPPTRRKREPDVIPFFV